METDKMIVPKDGASSALDGFLRIIVVVCHSIIIR